MKTAFVGVRMGSTPAATYRYRPPSPAPPTPLARPKARRFKANPPRLHERISPRTISPPPPRTTRPPISRVPAPTPGPHPIKVPKPIRVPKPIHLHQRHHHHVTKKHKGRRRGEPAWLSNLMTQLGLSNEFGGYAGGSPGSLVVPPSPSATASGTTIDPVLLLGGVGVVAVIGLIIYEWYRHKHAKQEKQMVKNEA